MEAPRRSTTSRNSARSTQSAARPVHEVKAELAEKHRELEVARKRLAQLERHRNNLREQLVNAQQLIEEDVELILHDLGETPSGHDVTQHFGKLSGNVVVHHTQAGFQGLLRRPFLRQYWQRDENGTNHLVREGEEHKASWNELFFDLIFVGVVASIGHEARQELDATHLTQYFILFAAVWNTWRETTVYINRFDTEDILHKFFFALEMCATVGIGIGAAGAFTEDDFWLFVVSLVTARTLLVLMNLRVMYYIPMARYNLTITALQYSFPSVIYAISLAVPNPAARLVIWLFAELFILFSSQFLVLICMVRQTTRRFLPISIEHMTERYGLFTILAIGEVVVNSIPTGVTDNPALPFLTGVLGVFLAFGTQWYYFDTDATKTYGTHAMRVGGRFRPWLYTYMHLTMHVSIVLCGALFGFLVQDSVYASVHEHSSDAHSPSPLAGADAAGGAEGPASSPLTDAARWAFCGSLAIALLSCAVMGLTHQWSFWQLRSTRHPIICNRYLQGFARLALPLLLFAVPPLHPSGIALAGIAAALVLVLAVLEFMTNYEIEDNALALRQQEAEEAERKRQEALTSRKQLAEDRRVAHATMNTFVTCVDDDDDKPGSMAR